LPRIVKENVARQTRLFIDVQDKQDGSFTCLLSYLTNIVGHNIVS